MTKPNEARLEALQAIRGLFDDGFFGEPTVKQEAILALTEELEAELVYTLSRHHQGQSYDVYLSECMRARDKVDGQSDDDWAARNARFREYQKQATPAPRSDWPVDEDE